MTRPSPEAPLLVGIDVGTPSVGAIAFDRRGRKVAAAARPTPIRPVETGGEHDPEAIFAATLEALGELGRSLGGTPIAGLAVASFGESCVLVGDDGRSLSPAITWHDRRTVPAAHDLAAAIGGDRVFAVTGLSIEPIFSLLKLAWMRDHWPGAFSAARRILLMADWIAFRLSGVAATDPSIASRTLYFDIHRRAWSEEMLAFAGVDPRRLPAIRASGTALGPLLPEVLAETGLAGNPIVGVGAHDHIVGSFAAGLVEPGVVLNSIGTAEAVLFATPAPLDDPALAEQGYFQGAVGTDRQMSYVGGGIYSSGGTIDWFREIAGGADQAALIAAASAVPPGCGGVAFLPHLVNAPPPHPDDHARGAFFGLTLSATRAALYRAVLEGLAMQARTMLDGMVALTGLGQPRTIRVIGGGARNHLLLSIKANVFARPIVVVDEPEATALGAALLGGVAAGVFANLDAALAGLDRSEHVIEPDQSAEAYARLKAMVFDRLHDTVRPINRALSALI